MMSGNIQNIRDAETAESPRQGHPFHRTHTAEEGAGGELEKVHMADHAQFSQTCTRLNNNEQRPLCPG